MMYLFFLLIGVCALIFSLFYSKSIDVPETTPSGDDDMSRTQMLRQLSALYSAYLICWPLLFMYLVIAFEIQPFSMYILPLLYPLILFGFRLKNLHLMHRRQTLGESQFRENMLVQHSTLIITSIIAISLVVQMAAGGKMRACQTTKNAGKIIVASILFAMVALSIESQSAPNNYHAVLSRARQSMVVHTSAAVFITGIMLFYSASMQNNPNAVIQD